MKGREIFILIFIIQSFFESLGFAQVSTGSTEMGFGEDVYLRHYKKVLEERRKHYATTFLIKPERRIEVLTLEEQNKRRLAGQDLLLPILGRNSESTDSPGFLEKKAKELFAQGQSEVQLKKACFMKLEEGLSDGLFEQEKHTAKSVALSGGGDLIRVVARITEGFLFDQAEVYFELLGPQKPESGLRDILMRSSFFKLPDKGCDFKPSTFLDLILKAKDEFKMRTQYARTSPEQESRSTTRPTQTSPSENSRAPD